MWLRHNPHALWKNSGNGGTSTTHTEKYTEQPHLEAEVPDAAAISETVPAEPADETMVQQTPPLKELVLWQHVASLWCCHLGMPLGGQNMIGPVSSLQCKGNDYTPNAAWITLLLIWHTKYHLLHNKIPPPTVPFSWEFSVIHFVTQLSTLKPPNIPHLLHPL